jgi:hypothetical protein
MPTDIAAQEHYLLISDGQHFAVVAKRAGKFCPLRTGVRHGLNLDDETVADLIRQSARIPREMRSYVWLTLHLSSEICSSTFDKADGVPASSRSYAICTGFHIAL